MEPTLPSPHGSPELGPQPPRGPEAAPLPNSGRTERLRPMERPAPQEQRTGAGAGDAQPVMPTVPQPVQAPQSSTTASTADDDTPVIAADEDLIEKEWVEKAKRVISETKHDPYAQEQAFSRLQAEYLNKRYGKTIKLPKEE